MEKSIQNHINFRTENYFLKQLAYSDSIYAWLLLHSHYNKDEKYNYIYKDEINYTKIGLMIHKSRQTVSKHFNKLLDEGIIRESKGSKKYYKIPYYNEFEEMDGETVFQLLCLPLKEQREEMIKVYAFLLKQKRESIKKGNKNFLCSHKQIIEGCGGTASHQSTYERMRCILTLLKGADIIKFRTIDAHQNEKGEWVGQMMEVYEVNNKASEEWLGTHNQKEDR